jgi:hypothetical protein
MTKVWQVSGDVDDQVVGAVDRNVSAEVVIEVVGADEVAGAVDDKVSSVVVNEVVGAVGNNVSGVRGSCERTCECR